MSNGSDLEIPVLYVKWKVNTRNKPMNECIFSSAFRFLGREWDFYYMAIMHKSSKVLGLEYKSYGECHPPFCITAHQVNGQTNKIMPGMSISQQITKAPSHMRIWEKPESTVQADPEYCRTHYLRFLVILKAGDDLTDTMETSVQTEEYLSGLPCMESLSEDFSKLMLDQDTNPDVEIQCSGISSKAHKMVLCTRSPVLKAMLNSAMSEGLTGVIKIDDMDADICRQFLTYLYTGKLEELDFDKAIRLYAVGNMYSVLSLARRCSDFLKEHLTLENVCDALIVADAHSDASVVEVAIAYILDNKTLMESDHWQAFSDVHAKLANKVLYRYFKLTSK